MKILKRFLLSTRGAVDITGVLVDVALAAALIPVIKSFITSAQGNLTATEYLLLSMVTLFIIIALVYNILKQTGVVSKK
jgi:hypothetical protein